MSREILSIRIVPIRTGTALTLAFFAAKIFGYITWSWWWVFAPIWLPSAVLLSALAVFALSASVFLATVFLWELASYRKWRK